MSVTKAPLPILANLQWTDEGRKRLDEVLAVLDALEAREHPLAKRARTEFAAQLLYLDAFGGTVSEQDPRQRFEVTLGSDLYPMAFRVTWRYLVEATGEYRFFLAGGLVWHGGPGDAGSVCLEPDVLWGIHT